VLAESVFFLPKRICTPLCTNFAQTLFVPAQSSVLMICRECWTKELVPFRRGIFTQSIWMNRNYSENSYPQEHSTGGGCTGEWIGISSQPQERESNHYGS